MTGAIATNYGSFHHAMGIPVAAYVASYVFLVYVNIYKRQDLDVHRESDLDVTEERTSDKMVGKSGNMEMGKADQVEIAVDKD